MASSSDSRAGKRERASDEDVAEDKENKKPKLEDGEESEDGEAEEGEGSEPESGVDEGDVSCGGLNEHNLHQLGAALFASPMSTSTASFMNRPPLAHSTPLSTGAGMRSGNDAAALAGPASSALNAMAMAAVAAYSQQQQPVTTQMCPQPWNIPTMPFTSTAPPTQAHQQPDMNMLMQQFGYGYRFPSHHHQQQQVQQQMHHGAAEMGADMQTPITGMEGKTMNLSGGSDSTSGIQSGSSSSQLEASSSSSSSSAANTSQVANPMALIDSLYAHMFRGGTGSSNGAVMGGAGVSHPIGGALTGHQQQQQALPSLPGPGPMGMPQLPQLPRPMQSLSSFEPFCSVPGRLTLLSNVKKYRVTLAEVKRRISPPECLNASILGGILRKAKNRDGGRVLRDALNQHGIVLPSGRRKSAPTTCFSSLVEEESVQLARDFDDVCKSHYPVKAASAYLLRASDTAYTPRDARIILYHVQRFLRRLIDFHQADRSPVGDRVGGGAGVLEAEWQKGLTNFSMKLQLTHGFGGLAMCTVLETTLRCLNECNARLADAENMGGEVAEGSQGQQGQQH